MRETLTTLKPYLWRYRRRLARGAAALLLKDLLAAALPVFIGRGVDSKGLFAARKAPDTLGHTSL